MKLWIKIHSDGHETTFAQTNKQVEVCLDLVDLVRAYSNHLNLTERLVRTVQRVRKAQERPAEQPISVRSTGRSEKQWRVNDRLSETDVRLLVKAFESGTPKWKLAEQYGISESSVKRVIRRHRAQHAST